MNIQSLRLLNNCVNIDILVDIPNYSLVHYQIDWNMVTPNHFPYRLQQAPGPKNALGRYKFNMPSSNAIYLHDKLRLRSDEQGGSAGEHAAARYRLGRRSRQCDPKAWQYETYVPICHQIPVNLFYLTAWVADDGKPQFRTDMICSPRRAPEACRKRNGCYNKPLNVGGIYARTRSGVRIDYFVNFCKS